MTRMYTISVCFVCLYEQLMAGTVISRFPGNRILICEQRSGRGVQK